MLTCSPPRRSLLRLPPRLIPLTLTLLLTTSSLSPLTPLHLSVSRVAIVIGLSRALRDAAGVGVGVRIEVLSHVGLDAYARQVRVPPHLGLVVA